MLKRILWAVVMVLMANLGFGQTVRVDIIVEKVTWTGYLGDEYGPMIRLYQNQWADSYPYLLTSPCIKGRDFGQTGSSGTIYPSRVVNFNLSQSSPTQKIIFVTHEERRAGSNDCTFDTSCGVCPGKDDRYQTSTEVMLNLNDFTPGIFSATQSTYTTYAGTYVYIDYRIRYTPSQLAPPTGNTSISCADNNYTISTSGSLPTNLNNLTGVSYKWQYDDGTTTTTTDPRATTCLANCSSALTSCFAGGGGSNCLATYFPCVSNCNSTYPPIVETVWKDLDVTLVPTSTFNPLNKIFTSGINSITKVRFRVQAIGPELSGNFSDPSNYSNFAPPSPKILDPITTDQSCPVGATGKVRINNIQGRGTYKFILRKGNNTAPCDPNTPGSCTPSGDISGDITGASYVINGVKKGDYTLLIVNPGGALGVCYNTYYPISVGEIPALASTAPSLINVSCYEAVDGSTSVTVSNGRLSDLSFDINNSPTFFTSSSGNTYFFGGLAKGNYLITAKDGGCSPNVNYNFTIRQPAKISESAFEKSDATCNTPGNGYFKTTVTKSSGTFDISGSAFYSYQLWNGGTSAFLEWETLDNFWTRSDLPVGNYELRIKEKGAVDYCSGFTRTFQIKVPIELAVGSLSTTKTRCYGSPDGEINVTATGGAGVGNYGYELMQISNSAIFTSTDGNFKGLAKDDYQLTIKNSLAGCTDKFVRADLISVGQPDSVHIELNKTDITCFGARNGQINATVSGGTPGYTYAWEKNIGASWASIGSNSPSIYGLLDGQYRLRVTDAASLGGCEKISGRISIIEPEVLSISSVTVNDIKCLGNSGTIQITPAGGTALYTFAYSTDNAATFTPFDQNTPLPANNYRVKVTDKNGCTFTDAATYKITDPPSILDFTFTQKSYGAFNISCFGGNNGEVTITATGGNGGSYVGYEYAWGGGSFAGNNIVSGITAGDKQISVRDARGCVVSKTVTFTQASQIVTLTAAKQDVECFGAATGSVQLSTSGGVGSFKFKLGTTTNTTGLFEKLPADNYSFTITDANNCGVTYNETIINLYPALIVTSSVQDVSCFAGTDGKITLTINGGVAPYQVKQGSTIVPNPIINLAKGNYDFVVTDSKGCTFPLTGIAVTQPNLLQVTKVILKDIECLGGKGSIDVSATGGTLPYVYEYSVNNGSSFTAFTNTTALAADTYLVQVKDAKGCVAQAAQPIIVTSPPAALDFTFTKSDYNGYNISCYGGTNGFAIVTPTGGNGGIYTGYQFSIDGKPYQAADKIEGIDAGDHVLSVKDARGCVASQSTMFTQSPVAITTNVVRTKDVTCFNETNGEIEMVANGGTAPYQFQIPTRPFQDGNVITQLGVGSYTITAKDKNGCRAEASTSIASLNPAIATSANIVDVSCYAGSDGSVEIIAGGGVPPFSYQWKDLAETSRKAANLKIGQYTVKVTDQAGCKVELTNEVKQPLAPLSVSLTSLAACWNQSNGTITATAKGGTAPYQFAINNNAYDASASFQKETGSHTVNVRDAKGCLTNASVSVGQRNTQPQYNFLVATKQYALDTLVLTEISVPKPDSIQWAFDPQAIIINKDPSAPQIKFSTEGKYWVEMKAYFGDCGYTQRKNLELRPYDPNAKPKKANGYRTIESMDVSPNPSNGEFDLAIKLSTKSKVTVIIFDMLGVIQFSNTWEPTLEIKTKIALQNVATGIYMLRATAETDAKDARLSINK
jgi:large repetitive protein